MPGKKILLVDTDLPAVEAFKNTFSEKGLQVYSADSSTDAIQKVAHYRPDLILLEIAISGEMDGWDVCYLLKKNDGTKKIPLVFFSGEASLQNQLHAFKIGANGFISKSLPKEKLINQVEQFLTRRENKEIED